MIKLETLDQNKKLHSQGMFFKIGTEGGEGCTLFPPRTGCQTHAPQISGKTFQIQKHLAENNQNDSTFYSNPFEIRIGVPPLLFLLFNFLLCSSAFRFSQKALITFDPISFLYLKVFAVFYDKDGYRVGVSRCILFFGVHMADYVVIFGLACAGAIRDRR